MGKLYQGNNFIALVFFSLNEKEKDFMGGGKSVQICGGLVSLVARLNIFRMSDQENRLRSLYLCMENMKSA